MIMTLRQHLRRSNDDPIVETTTIKVRQMSGKGTTSTPSNHVVDLDVEKPRTKTTDVEESADTSSSTQRRPAFRTVREKLGQTEASLASASNKSTESPNNLGNAFSLGPKLGQRISPLLSTTFRPKATVNNSNNNAHEEMVSSTKVYSEVLDRQQVLKSSQITSDVTSDTKQRSTQQPSIDGITFNIPCEESVPERVMTGIPAGSGPGGKVNIVILGGSFTGLSVAVTLAKNPPRDACIITLVEPKSYLEVRWATIRSLFNEDTCSNSTISLSKILSSHPIIRHVRARAMSIEMDAVRLDDNRALPYDVLLVATGAIHSFSALTPHLSPGTLLPPADALSERRRFLRETGDAILRCRSIAVIGGGPVGTELAADIASFGRARGRVVSVTLIDNKDKLMPDYPRSVSQKLREKLLKLDVRLILGQRAEQVDDGSWILLESGEKIEVEMVLKTTGVLPSAKGIFGSESESVRDGWVRTDRFGRVIGCRGDVFAGGDCCDWSAKSGENTLANRNALGHNIRTTAEAIANCRALASIDSKLKRVSVSHRPPAIVASAPREGENSSPFAALSPSWWWMKNRGIMLAKAQKEIGW